MERRSHLAHPPTRAPAISVRIAFVPWAGQTIHRLLRRANIVNYIRVFLDHLPRGEDLNGYRKRYRIIDLHVADACLGPQHDASKLAPVSIWVQGGPVFHTKGGGIYSLGSSTQHCLAAGCSCSSTCSSTCSCGCCQAGIVAHSFLRTEPVSDILSQ